MAKLLISTLLRFALLTAEGQSPTVTVDGPTQIADTSAIIAVTINPNGSPTGFYVQWGFTTAYGQTGPVNIVPIPNAVTNVSAWMVGLSPSTTYHYQVVATNSTGTGYSADMTLTTASSPPTGSPPAVAAGTPWINSATNVTVAGSLNPNGQNTSYFFQWGTTAAYGNSTPLQTLEAGGAIGWFPVSADLTGLIPSTTYHYRLIATNNAGSAFGDDQSFTTLGIISLGGHLFTYSTNGSTATIVSYSGPGGDVTIPGTIAGLPVTAIGFAAFKSPFPSITNVTLPGSLTSIGDYAFEYCLLTNVTVPDGVTSIGDFAFSHCWTLANLHLSSSLKSIGDYAFWYCGSLTNLVIPDAVTNVGDAAFFFCGSLANLHLGNGLATIGPSVFFGCSSLTKVTIPDGITNIADGLNVGRALGAFNSCNNLTNVIVGKGLAYLGVEAFGECPNLRSLFFSGNAPTPSQYGVFSGSGSVIVYYLAGTTGWEATYAGRPTRLWNPMVETSDGGPGVRQNGFGFYVTGTADIPLVIEACTNVAAPTWLPLQYCTLTNGSIHFTDPQWAIQPSRFYRIRSP